LCETNLMKMARTGQLLIVFCWLCAAAVGLTNAAEVTIQVSSRETYVGVPITVRIAIENATKHEEPIFPEIPGATVRSAGGPNRSSQITMINGKTTQNVSDTYNYRLTPHKTGRISIPAIAVQADGKEYKTKPVVIVVTKSETDDLLFVELKGKRKSLYVGEPLEVTLQIWLKPYLNRQYNIKLTEADMWSRVDLQNSQWGVFADTLQNQLSRRRRPSGREALRKDSQGNERAYYLFELNKTIWPQRPGALDVDELNVLVSYPTRLARNQSFFSMGNLIVAETRPLAAQAQVEPIEVKAIPAEGRPIIYRGAVGQYEISASAKPTQVAVGDPITITLAITGTGQLEQLQPPPLPELPELTRDFKVPTEPLAGEIKGNSKHFTQSIRAKNDEVTAVPAIPFAYFDPQRETFVTVRTKPIPLTVEPAAKLSATQIIDAGTGRTVARSLTEVSGGILANYTGMDEVLSQQGFAPGWPSAVVLGLGPFVFLATWLVQRHRDRLRCDVSFARRRSAKHVALGRVHDAARAGGTELAASLAAALGGYVADRCNLPTGGLTRAAVVEQLHRRGVHRDVVDQIDQLLDACESMQYAGGAGTNSESLVQDARRCIHRLERERF